MTEPALTSVIMVSYYTGAALEKTLAAVLTQTAPVELIFVNNGNSPNNEAKLAARAKSDPRFKFISGHGNIGFSKGCNLGVRAAKGSFLLFLGPEALLPSDAIAHLRRYATELKPPFMIGARVQDEKGKDLKECRRVMLTPRTAIIEEFHLYSFFPRERLNIHKESLPKAIAPVPAISEAFMFLSAEDFGRMHGFDEGYFLHIEDMDFCLRFRRAHGEIYFAPDVVVTRLGSDKISPVLQETREALGLMRYFHDNFGHAYPQPFLWLLDLNIWARVGYRILLAQLSLFKK